MKKIFDKFKKFAMSADVISLAVAVILGASVSAIVGSLVKDVITPLIGIVMGGVEFSELSITFGNAHIAYGAFIQAIINFFVTAVALFIIVELVERSKKAMHIKKEEAKPKDQQIALLEEIRDLLKKD